MVFYASFDFNPGIDMGLLWTNNKQTWGINKTVGWAWDVTNFNYLIDLAFLANLMVAMVVIISLLIKRLVEAINK